MLQMVLAQALVEHGLLDSLAAGILHARTHLELYIGQGNSTYVLLGGIVLILVLLFRRRR
jgi:LPXTG-motif cell wall-anchored protein